jgi:hypothetical protein
MTFEEVLPFLRKGRKVRQVDDKSVYYAVEDNRIECYDAGTGYISGFCYFHGQILDDNWEVLK